MLLSRLWHRRGRQLSERQSRDNAGESSMNVKRKEASSGEFVQFERSGAVSIRIQDYLRSDAGKEQLAKAKEIRSRELASHPGQNRRQK